MWQPDGWSWRARIGVLTPSADIGPESELRAMAPEGVGIHAARAPFGGMVTGDPVARALENIKAFATPPALDNAAEQLAAAPLHAIVYGFTSTSYVGGEGDDESLKTRLEQKTRGIPLVTTCAAARLALRALGAKKLALIDPPWFPLDLTRLGAHYFEHRGVSVVSAYPAKLPGGQRDVHPAQVFEWVRANVPVSAEAVFIGGNGFRVVGAIQALEEDLGRPVLTANQVLLWQALQIAGTRVPVVGYGQIFNYRA